jgi:hypothetical protein
MRKLRTFVLLFAAVGLLLGAVPASGAADPAEAPCVHLTLPLSAPVGTSSCPGVRPGAVTIIPSEGVLCTLGFVYTDRSGITYITTAGHCIAAEGKQHSWAPGKGPVAQDSRGKAFGRFVFGALKGNYDVALIQVNKGVSVKSSLCHFGGPTGLTTSRAAGLRTIEHYGNATGISAALPARTGLVLGMEDPWTVPALIPSFKGDSGGPVVTAGTGKAVGYITSLTVSVNTVQGLLPVAPPVFITRLGPQMALVSKTLKKTFTLRTAGHSASTASLP